jgi:uncharacterized delta-60 repeat protein
MTNFLRAHDKLHSQKTQEYRQARFGDAATRAMWNLPKQSNEEDMKTSLKKFAGNFLSTRLSQLVVCAALVSASTLGLAQAGHLDTSFASNGIFTLSMVASQLNAVALQSDGKIVAAGQLGGQSGLIRLTTKGALDDSFGKGGVVVVSKFGGDIEQVIIGMAIQSDGKIVATATAIPGGGQVGRFNTDGSLDTTFGVNGIATLPLTAAQMALQSDGNVIVTGGNGRTFVMARLNSNGQLDPTFGSGGVAPLVTFLPSVIALQADGKILIGSGAFAPAPVLNPLGGAGSLARYNTNGSLDKSFGISGQAASLAAPAAIAVQSDGKILAAGADTSSVAASGNSSGFGVVRFNPNGSVDATFGAHGGAITGFPNTNLTTAFALALQPNGDIVAGGEAGNVQTFTHLSESFALARYVDNGKLDSTFGTKGRVTTSFGSNAAALITSVVLQSDGKIVVAGTNGGNSFEVARYLGQ